MKQVVIASGKGGTGKTGVAASFATLAGPLVTVDADVDAADLHLLLNPRKIHEEDFYGGVIAKVHPDKCVGCGECVDTCRFGALLLNEFGVAFLDRTACEGCGVCSHVCPSEAIEMVDRLSGRWFVSETDCGPMVHARLEIASENSGKMVTLLRREAGVIAESNDYDIILIDGPPGIGCPVMAAVTGVDLIACVAEPTLSGAHDLGRILDLAEHFSIRAVVMINKCDINTDVAREIKSSCEKRGVEIVAEIPYDPDVVGAIVQGVPLVDHSDGPAAQEIGAAWERVYDFLTAKT